MANMVAAAGTASQTIATSETVVATITPEQTVNMPGQPGVLVSGWVSMQGAASVTSVTLHIRKGSGTGGTSLASVQYTLTTNTRSDEIRVLDTSTDADGLQWTLTATAAGASATALLSMLTAEPVQTLL